jgi:hypothetical protein
MVVSYHHMVSFLSTTGVVASWCCCKLPILDHRFAPAEQGRGSTSQHVFVLVHHPAMLISLFFCTSTPSFTVSIIIPFLYKSTYVLTRIKISDVQYYSLSATTTTTTTLCVVSFQFLSSQYPPWLYPFSYAIQQGNLKDKIKGGTRLS